LGLGGVGVRLSDLTKLYVGLARLGTTVDLSERASEAGEAPHTRRLIERVAAWYVGNVLVGAPPPDNAVSGRIAFKTGTSYGYRDAWAVGFDGKRTVGVWVGRADGAPVPGLVGRTATAPILFDAFARLGRLTALPPAPSGALMATNARLPLPLQRFRPGFLPSAGTSRPPRILFPPDGARLELAGTVGERPDPVALKIAGGVEPLTVLVNGVPLSATAGRRTLFFRPDGPGFVRLTVMDSAGSTTSVLVRLQ
jgi:penicillin-binding protein 1C